MPDRPPSIPCAHDESTLHHCPNKYTYNPLADSARWIRLLSLYPADDVDAPLHARLWPVPRSEAPRFEPVSYTWGQEESTSCIWVKEVEDTTEPASADFKCIPIRPNLEKLLRQLRRRGKRGVPLWVDALCINQEDHHEKGFQVRHMDEVYRNRQIVIWLGDRSETSDVALDFLKEWKPFCNEDRFSEGYDYLKNMDIPHKWSALWDLLGRSWFSRRWIVQEFVLSAHKHVYVGDRDFCWVYLNNLVRVMERTKSDVGLRKKSNVCKGLVCHCSNEPAHEAEHYLPDTPDRLESLKSLQEAYEIFHGGQETNMPLEKLVDDFCGFFSQDPRDGIYAFLSLATDTTGSEWIPDYSPENSVTQVYAQATRHIIRQTGKLDIICRSNPRHRVRDSGHPHSWIPWFGPASIDYDNEHSHTVHGYRKKSLTTFGQPVHVRGAAHRLRRCCPTLCKGCDAPIVGVRNSCESCSDFDFCDGCVKNASSSHDADHTFQQFPPKFGVYSASGATSFIIGPEAEFGGLRDRSHMSLVVRGWFVDIVTKVGQWIEMSREPARVSLGVAWPTSSDTGAVKREGLPDGFFRATAGNRCIRTVRGADNLPEREVSHVPQEWSKAVREFWMRENHVFKSDSYETIVASISVMASGSRRLAFTGQSGGFVPDGTEPGDAVCILAGCTVPVVLRKRSWESDSGWVLIGECYIEGLMEGEFTKEMEVKNEVVEPGHISLE